MEQFFKRMCAMVMDSSWFNVFARTRRSSALRLFCFHYAGGGASMFRDWDRYLPARVQVVAIQLPGREKRFLEARYRQLRALVTDLAGAISPFLDVRYCVLGHSMGALIAFELIREIQRLKLRLPSLYFPAGHRAPQLPDNDPPIRHLPDHDFVRELLERYNETLAPAMAYPELRELLLPLMRDDVSLCETYRYEHGPLLSCPIVALGGAADPDVSETSLASWRDQTSASFRYQIFPGGHFFIDACKSQVLQFVREALEYVG